MTETMRALLLGRGPEWILDEVPAPYSGARAGPHPQ